MILGRRETDVLTAVVETYVETAQPVASQALAAGLGLSPASLRSTMAALTEKGYLQQPHTSAVSHISSGKSINPANRSVSRSTKIWSLVRRL